MVKEISVIIPSYNGELYIPETMKSLEEQTLGKRYWEVIAVDDASCDKTFEILNKGWDFDLKVLKNKKNLGVGRTRNNGSRFASGRFLVYLDDDDLLRRDCLERCLQEFKSGADFIYSDHASISADSSFRNKEENVLFTTKKPAFVLKDFLKGRVNFVGHIKGVRKELFIPFKNLPYAEDLYWIVETALGGAKFSHIPEVLYYWRRGVNGISESIDPRKANYWHNLVFDRAERYLENGKKIVGHSE